MTGDVMDLLQYTFFQHALLGSLLASIACGIYQRRNHSCFFRRNRVRIVCRNFPDTIGSRILGIISFWCRVA